MHGETMKWDKVSVQSATGTTQRDRYCKGKCQTKQVVRA